MYVLSVLSLIDLLFSKACSFAISVCLQPIRGSTANRRRDYFKLPMTEVLRRAAWGARVGHACSPCLVSPGWADRGWWGRPTESSVSRDGCDKGHVGAPEWREPTQHSGFRGGPPRIALFSLSPPVVSDEKHACSLE